jgi:hypothetical protein
MSILRKANKLLLLIVFLGLFNSLEAQFENMGMRITSSEMETDMINDSNNNYLRLMLCGDILHSRDLFNKHTTRDEYRNISYRTWFRQIKPLFFFSDFVVANLKTNFPDYTASSKFEFSAPDEFLGELSYSGCPLYRCRFCHTLSAQRRAAAFSSQALVSPATTALSWSNLIIGASPKIGI